MDKTYEVLLKHTSRVKLLFIAVANDPVGYAITFGYSGTYWGYVQEIAAEKNIAGLINLKISEVDGANILSEAGFIGYRYDESFMPITQSRMDYAMRLGKPFTNMLLTDQIPIVSAYLFGNIDG